MTCDLPEPFGQKRLLDSPNRAAYAAGYRYAGGNHRTRERRVGAINWGLVSGRSQTIYPWDSWKKKYTEEPNPWFHDVFRKDGTPYDSHEVELIRELSGASKG